MGIQPNGLFHRFRSLLFLPVLLPAIAAGSPCQARTVTAGNARLGASPPISRITAGYLEIENHGHKTVVLDRISSPDYHRIEMHRTVLSDGVAGMQLLKEIPIPAYGRLAFRPGGYHLMLYRNLEPLKIGESTTLTLHFRGGDTLSVTAEVKAHDELQQHHH